MTLSELANLPMIERETILREMRDKHTRCVEKRSAEIVDLADVRAAKQK